MEYNYYILMGDMLARRTGQFQCEWLMNGEWVKSERFTLSLEDSLMDYGNFSIGDNDSITPEMAEKLIENGTIVLQGDIGYGAYYNEPKTIKLSCWKKPCDNASSETGA